MVISLKGKCGLFNLLKTCVYLYVCTNYGDFNCEFRGANA
jgi:hypothetical protein